MFRFPFNGFPFVPYKPYNNYNYNKLHNWNNSNTENNKKNSINNSNKTINTISYNSTNYSDKDFEQALFELFGIKLYLDDLIIIGILFFLYQEKVKDDLLYIILFLLLFS